MNKIFIDTNIVLDLLGKREPFYEDTARLFSLADRDKIELHVSALTIANSNYILTKLKSAREAREILTKFKILVNVNALTDKIIGLSLNDASFKDFEDGIQYYTALENGAEIIVTRNLKDFKNSTIPTMTTSQYLKK